MTTRWLYRCFILLIILVILTMVIIGYTVLLSDQFPYNGMFPEDYVEEKEDEAEIQKIIDGTKHLKDSDINVPILIWWTGFTGEPGSFKQCGANKCFTTVNKWRFTDHPQTKAFMFYGTDTKVTDLPLPRKPHHEWALLHEESPKNNQLFSHAPFLTLFNHTSTFKRQSDYPLTTQHIEGHDWLMKTNYMLPTSNRNRFQKELAPIIYAQSDCKPPSDRDHYVTMLQKYMKVDSYGACLHNKDIPEHIKDPIAGMEHKDFYKLISKYKFALAMENGVCDDYITEKVWRPLMIGTVPIIYGSPKIKEILPAEKSAIIVNDFKTVKDLANHLTMLNNNDHEYEKYLQWKHGGITNQWLKDTLKNREWKITDNEYFDSGINFIEGFECFVCNRIHENLDREKQNIPPLKHQATVDHYGCPRPVKFDDAGRIISDGSWDPDWDYMKHIATRVREYIDKNDTASINSKNLYGF